MDPELYKRVWREQKFHSEQDVLAKNIRIKKYFPHLEDYPSKTRLYSLAQNFTNELKGKTILDYGCGRGEKSLKYLKDGADYVYGIDISKVYIDFAIQKVDQLGFKNIEFLIMDAHQLIFAENTFDLVVGNGILHHLDLKIALESIFRVLKPDGRALFIEPLADNPLLKLFRFLTPKARTPDEKPLTRKQLKEISNNRWQTEFSYCGLTNAGMSLVTSIIFPNDPDNLLLKLSDKLETWLNRKNLLQTWNQYILINMIKKV